MPDFDSKTQELLIAMLLMAGLLAVVAIGIQVIAVYRRRMISDDSEPDLDLAASIRDAYEAGEISTDEYHRIRETIDRGPPPLAPPTPPASLDPAQPDPPGPAGDDAPHPSRPPRSEPGPEADEPRHPEP